MKLAGKGHLQETVRIFNADLDKLIKGTIPFHRINVGKQLRKELTYNLLKE